MTYGEMKQRVLELVFSYSVAGTEIPATYNNQADYVGMIPGLINRAENEIATGTKRLYASKKLTELESVTVGNLVRYQIPNDCWMILTAGLLVTLPRHRQGRYTRYRLLGGKYIEMAPGREDVLTLEYWRYPERVTVQTEDETELDNTPDVHECIVYYVAAYLLQYDDSYRYKELYNEYQKRKAELKEPVWMEIEPIENLYHIE